MWTFLAFISALCLGFYDISKKIALRDHPVVDVLTLSVCFSAVLLSVPLICSRFCPAMMVGTPFYVPTMDLQAHLFTVLKSLIVLSSWVCAYMALKHLPISVVSPMQATRPMWTLVGALLIFGERLNTWQWIGVCIALGTILAFSFFTRKPRNSRDYRDPRINRYYVALALAILLGAASGLYDKYLMRRYDHNAVQVYYTIYQAVMMMGVWVIEYARHPKRPRVTGFSSFLPIALISIFLIISDNVYMLALRDPDSLIAVVSTIRRGGAVIGFAYGLLFLKEENPLPKVLCMIGIGIGLLCLAFGA